MVRPFLSPETIALQICCAAGQVNVVLVQRLTVAASGLLPSLLIGVAHEEKETDVSIGISLLNDAHKNCFERAYLVTRDSLSPQPRRLWRTGPGSGCLLPGSLERKVPAVAAVNLTSAAWSGWSAPKNLMSMRLRKLVTDTPCPSCIIPVQSQPGATGSLWISVGLIQHQWPMN